MGKRAGTVQGHILVADMDVSPLSPKSCPVLDSLIVIVPSTMVQANGDPQIARVRYG